MSGGVCAPRSPAVRQHRARGRGDLEEHVLQRGRGRSSALASAGSGGHSAARVDPDDRVAVAQPDVTDRADLDSGDAGTVWPLAGWTAARRRARPRSASAALRGTELAALLVEDYAAVPAAITTRPTPARTSRRWGCIACLIPRSPSGTPNGPPVGGRPGRRSWVSQATSGRCTGGLVRCPAAGPARPCPPPARRVDRVDVEQRRVGVVDAALAVEAGEGADDLLAHLLIGVAVLDARDRRLGERHSTLAVHDDSARSWDSVGHQPAVEVYEARHGLAQVGGEPAARPGRRGREPGGSRARPPPSARGSRSARPAAAPRARTRARSAAPR